MNRLLTRKKHSKRIAKLLLECKIIDQKFYDDLYVEGYERYKTANRKRYPDKYRNTLYYWELHYGTCDYWGECDEHSIKDYALDYFMFSYVNVDNHEDMEFNLPYQPTTKNLIRFFTELKPILLEKL